MSAEIFIQETTAEIAIEAGTPTSRPRGSGTGHATRGSASGSGSQRFSGSGSGQARSGGAAGSGTNGLPLVWDSVDSLTLPGEVFSGPVGATWIDATGVLHTSTVPNTPRPYYAYDANGVLRQLRLLEGGATNLLLNNRTGLGWAVAANVTLTPNATAGIDGTPNAAMSVSWANASTNAGVVTRASAVSATAKNSKSLWIRADEAGGTVGLADAQQTVGQTIVTLTTEWQRVSLSEVQPGGLASCWIRKQANSPSVIYLDGVQVENNPFPTSTIFTTTTAVSRSAEVCTVPIAFGPQALTLYMDTIELGTMSKPSQGFLEISGAIPYAILWNNSGTPRMTYRSASVQVNADTPGAVATYGQRAEYRGLIYPDGSAQIGQSVNGGTEGVSARAGTNVFGGAWGTMIVRPNAGGVVSSGFVAIRSIKIALATNLTRDQMRAFV